MRREEGTSLCEEFIDQVPRTVSDGRCCSYIVTLGACCASEVLMATGT